MLLGMLMSPLIGKKKINFYEGFMMIIGMTLYLCYTFFIFFMNMKRELN